MTFFIDENLSWQLAAGMKGFGESVISLREKFPRGTEDVDWLKFVGEEGMVLVTRDEKIRWRPAELAALREHRVGTFFLGGKNLSRCELIQQLVRNWPRMKESANKTTPPYAFRVPRSGTKFVRIVL